MNMKNNGLFAAQNYDAALFSETLARFGLSFDPKTMACLDDFAGKMLAKNQVMNLTNLTAPADVAVKHLADSLLLLHAYTPEEGTSLLDVGTGAGFPAVPLAICCPNVSVTAMDATAKKIDFIRESCAAMGLQVQTLVGRAEDLGKKAQYRETFDTVVARAVASLPALAELCLPFVKVGGYFCAMKGAAADEELAAARQRITELGGSLVETVRYELDATGENKRVILRVQKVKNTPAKYPRAWAKIKG